jgi:hypothetical protein
MLETTFSFVAELSQEHDSLLGQLSHVQEAFHEYLPGGASLLADRLRALKTSLLRHFFFEEQGGYMSQVLEQAPHLHRSAQELLAEHHLLGLELDALIESASAVPPDRLPPVPLQQRVEQWMGLVRRHEAKENQLIQGTCNQDLGAED